MRSLLLAMFALTLAIRPAAAGDTSTAPCAPAAGPRDATAHSLGTLMVAASAVGFSGAVLVARADTILLRQGYGLADRAAGTPVTAGMAFDIGSITKQFTAAGILELEVQGKLAVEQPLGAVLSGVPADKAGITLHQILTHTAGLPEYSGGDYDAATRDSTVAGILAAPLEVPPGSAFRYSNAGYSVLAAVIEQVSGQPYERFLNTACFRPAGLAHTGYRLPGFRSADLPHGYWAGADSGSPLDHAWAQDGPFWNLLGNGGMLSTVDDLYAWIQALRGDAVLPEAARRKLFTPNLREYAYGWNVRETVHGRRIGHGGSSDNGFNGAVTWYPECGLSIVVLSNAGENDIGQGFAAAVGTMLEHRLFDPKPQDVPDFHAVEVPAGTLQALAGTYGLKSGGTFSVQFDAARLSLEPAGQDAANFLIWNATDDATAANRCSARTTTIVEGLLKGDLAPLRAAVGDSARAERFVKALGQTKQDAEAENGPIQGFDILGTTPTWWTTGDDLATIVRLRSAHGARVFRLHWHDGQVSAVGGSGIPNPARTPLVPTSRVTFMGFHLGIARPVEVRFSRPGRGGADTMELVRDGRTLIATRLPSPPR